MNINPLQPLDVRLTLNKSLGKDHALFTHEIQLLSRQKGDFHFHRNAALSVDISGQIGFRSYFFAGRRSLVILLENRDDVDQVLSVLPRYAAVSVREVHGGISAEDSSSASSAA